MRATGKITSDQPLKRILIVEDNLIIQKADKFIFESLGFIVDIAKNGEQAISLFQPGKFAIVLLDIGLPDMNGYEVCQRLIAMEQGTGFHVPIIGISTHIASEEKELALTAGMEEMLSNPLLIDQAKVLLKRYGIILDTSFSD